MPLNFSQKLPRILLHPDSCGSGTWRLAEPAMELRRRAQAITLIRKDRFLTNEEILALRPDIIVVQRALGEAHVSAVERYRKTCPSAFIVFDMDDLLWAIPSHSPAAMAAESSADIISRAKRISRICDRIVLSTDHLRSHWLECVSADVAKIEVVGPYLPEWFFSAIQEGQREARNKVRDDKRTRIGFAGSVTHVRTLNRLVKTIRETTDQLQWVFMGCKPEGVDDLIEFHPLCEIDAYPKVLGSLGLDIAIAPFSVSAFDYCKTNLRLVELGALGVPVLTDHHDRGQFSHLNRALSSPEAFLNMVRTAITAYDADASLQGVYENYNLPDHIEKIFRSWLPKDAVVGLTVERKDISLIPEDRKIFGVYPENLPLNCGSVSFLTNDGIYPHPGTFSAISESAASALPVASGGVLASTLHPFAGSVVLNGRAVAKLGLPDWGRFENVAEALIDWGEWAAEHGFGHCLSADQFVWREKPGPTPTVNLSRIVGWHPRMPERCQKNQENFEEGQAALCELVERAFAATRLESAAPGATVRFVVNAIEEEVAQIAEENSGPVLFAECVGGFLRIVHPPLPNVPEFCLSQAEGAHAFESFLDQMHVEGLEVKSIRCVTIDDLRVLSHRAGTVFPDTDLNVIEAVKAQM